jgi:hypothetical protein
MAVYVAYAPVRRARLARDLLHDRDGALAHERDGHRMGAHAVAGDAAGGEGGANRAATSPSLPRAIHPWIVKRAPG